MLSGKRMEEAMGMLIIRHKVKDYDKWRPMFDRHSLMQKAAVRLSSSSIPRTRRGPRISPHRPTSRETMAKAGVMDDPTIYFLESV
jgi:hypothetical protein